MLTDRTNHRLVNFKVRRYVICFNLKDTTSILTTDSEMELHTDKDAESIVDGFIEDF